MMDRGRGQGRDDKDAVSEDRIHDLRIMRPTRYQLRYHRLGLGTGSVAVTSARGGRRSRNDEESTTK